MSTAEIGPEPTYGARDVPPRHTSTAGHPSRSDRFPRAEVGLAGAPDGYLARAAVTNPAALAMIYDRYSSGLFDFCVGLLRDRHTAGDCVQEVFCTAAVRLGQLREPEKLRAWLYAIARHEALARLKAHRRETPVEQLPDRVALEHGPEALAGRRELVDLVAAAAGGLSDRDRCVLELHYRQGLDGPELADALGVSATNANTLVGRLRTTVERCLGALLLARRARAGRSECTELDAVLALWDGEFTVLWRKRIARHAEHCPTCQTQQKAMVNPKALLGSVPVLIPAPHWLRAHTLTHAGPLLPPTAAAPAAGSAVPGSGTGSWWPGARVGGWWAVSPTHLAVAVPLAAIPVAAVLVLSAAASGGAVPAAPVAVAAAPAAGAVGAAPSFAYDTPTTQPSPVTTPPAVVAPGPTPRSAAPRVLPRGPVAPSATHQPRTPAATDPSVAATEPSDGSTLAPVRGQGTEESGDTEHGGTADPQN